MRKSLAILAVSMMSTVAAAAVPWGDLVFTSGVPWAAFESQGVTSQMWEQAGFKVNVGRDAGQPFNGVLSLQAEVLAGFTSYTVIVTNPTNASLILTNFDVTVPVHTTHVQTAYLLQYPSGVLTNEPLIWTNPFPYSFPLPGGGTSNAWGIVGNLPRELLSEIDQNVLYVDEDDFREGAPVRIFVAKELEADFNDWFTRPLIYTNPGPTYVTNYPEWLPRWCQGSLVQHLGRGFATNLWDVYGIPWDVNPVAQFGPEKAKSGWFSYFETGQDFIMCEMALAVTNPAAAVSNQSVAWITNSPMPFFMYDPGSVGRFPSWQSPQYQTPAIMCWHGNTNNATNPLAATTYTVTIEGREGRWMTSAWDVVEFDIPGAILPTTPEVLTITPGTTQSLGRLWVAITNMTIYPAPATNARDVVRVMHTNLMWYGKPGKGIAQVSHVGFQEMFKDRYDMLNLLDWTDWQVSLDPTNGANIGAWEGEGFGYAAAVADWHRYDTAAYWPYEVIETAGATPYVSTTPLATDASKTVKSVMTLTNEMPWEYQFTVTASGGYSVTNKDPVNPINANYVISDEFGGSVSYPVTVPKDDPPGPPYPTASGAWSITTTGTVFEGGRDWKWTGSISPGSHGISAGTASFGAAVPWVEIGRGSGRLTTKPFFYSQAREKVGLTAPAVAADLYISATTPKGKLYNPGGTLMSEFDPAGGGMPPGMVEGFKQYAGPGTGTDVDDIDWPGFESSSPPPYSMSWRKGWALQPGGRCLLKWVW